jgi:hypothetical protein
MEATIQEQLRVFPTSTFIYTATFPASASYTGDITEVGLQYKWHSSYSGYSYYYYSHALIQDAEGNPITITRTDTDTIIVTATVYVTITSSDLVLTDATSNKLLDYFVTMTTSIRQAQYFVFPTFLPKNVPLTATEFSSSYGNTYNLEYKYLASSSDDATAKTITWGTTRIAEASELNGHQIAAVWLMDIGYVPLPNATLFATYTTANTQVGIGDGSEDTFVCPIPCFVENTDVVKIAGVTKTRGTDYTIEHDGNSIKDIACMASSKATIISPKITAEDYSYVTPFANGFNHLSSTTFFGISDTQPLVLDMGEAVSCNTLYLAKICSMDDSYTTTAVIYLEYSTNNIDWITALTIASTTYARRTGTVPTGGPEFTFTEVSARYWRLRAEFSARTTLGLYQYQSDADVWWLGHVGQGIVFTTPPATDEIITIAADVASPWKTADYVIDCGFTLSF